MKLSVIGTGSISDSLIEAMQGFSEIELDAICSRSEDSARSFMEKYGFKRFFLSVEELALSDTEAVYIASPNNCHFVQAKTLLEQKKHTLLEKPFTSNLKQMKILQELAKQNNTIIMEAITIPSLPNFQKLKEILPSTEEIIKVNLAFAKVSSKLDRFLEGEFINSLSAQMSGGSLVDLGVYGIWFAVSLWGEPHSISHHSVTRINADTDGRGLVVLSYEHFDVEIIHSKISNDGLDAHIFTKKKQYIAHGISTVNKIIAVNTTDQELKNISVAQEPNHYHYEVKEFIECVKENRQSTINSLENTAIVMRILDEARRQSSIVFPDDE